MKKLLLPLLIIILTVVALLLYLRDNPSSSIDSTSRDFRVDDTASVTQIHMTDRAGNAVKLVRVTPGSWKVNDKYFARRDGINLLLKTMYGIRYMMPIPATTKENVIKSMAASNTKVEIFSGDKLTKVYYIGGTNKEQTGTYMLLEDPITHEKAQEPVVVHLPGLNGYVSSRYFISESEWRDRTVFRYNPKEIKKLSVHYTRDPEKSFSVMYGAKANNSIQLFDFEKNEIEQFDTLRAREYSYFYNNLSYEGVVNQMEPEKVDSILSTEPFVVVSVEDINGIEKQLKGYLKKAVKTQTDFNGVVSPIDLDRMYALINDDQDFVLIQYYVFDKIFVEFVDFQPKDGLAG